MTKARLVVIAAVGVAMGMAEGTARAGFCPYWGCGDNSATVGDHIVFDELSTTPGVPDDAGIYISYVELPHQFKSPGTLMVARDRLSAKDVNGTLVKGQDLVGTIITIKHLDGRTYQLKLTQSADPCNNNGNCLIYWSTPNDSTDPSNGVPFYTFIVKKIKQRDTNPGSGPDDGPKDNDFKNDLCQTPQPLLRELVRARQWKTEAKESAVVFTGDHYDPVTKKVLKGKVGWFNLGCAGTVPAKMHLLRHTEAGSIASGPNKRTTTLDQRTAMLRMLIADYCGNGSSFTFDHVALNYGDVNGWYPYPKLSTKLDTRSRSFEAVWNGKGPMCLTDPRKACLDAIEEACQLSLNNPNWKLPPVCPDDGTLPPGENAHALSANSPENVPMSCLVGHRAWEEWRKKK